MEWITTLKKAIDFMETNLCNDISADDVAKEFCKNPIVLVHFLYNILHWFWRKNNSKVIE